MKTTLYLFGLLIGGYIGMAQTVVIPDYRFEQALVDMGIDSDGEVNGQMLLADALLITELELSTNTIPNYPYDSSGDYFEGLINDLTGIEAFVNLETLIIHTTNIEELNLSTLVNLRYLDCVDNSLSSIDVSNNPLLEYLDISTGGDLLPMNSITEVDLSHNPNIHTLIASGIRSINLNNNNNNANMLINFGCAWCWGNGPDYIHDHVCIKVDDPQGAQLGEYPYSEWTVGHMFMSYSYTDDLATCALTRASFDETIVRVYPNPVQDILYIDTNDDVVNRVVLYDLSGRKVLEEVKVQVISVSGLQQGNYILKVFTDKGVQTHKVIVQ